MALGWPLHFAAAAVGVSPERLEFVWPPGQPGPLLQKVFLQNLDWQPTTVQISLGGKVSPEDIRIRPFAVFLPPRQIFPVEISVFARKNIRTEVQIRTVSAGSAALAISAGLKIPLLVRTGTGLGNSTHPFFAASFLALTVTVLFYFLRRKIKSLRIRSITN